MQNKKIKMGIIGLGQRGMALIDTIIGCEEAEIVALCDVYEDRREAAKEKVKKNSGNIPVLYENYKDLLTDKEVEAVLVASSWDEHIKMAIESMRAGKITAMEVGGAYDLEECWELVRTYEETGTPIMMMENCCFDRFELLATSLARKGMFGEIVHLHGAYSHDLREEILGGNVNRHYRLNNYQKRNCENYPTHELGPIAKLIDINRGNKLLTVSSFTSKAAGLKEFVNEGKSSDPELLGKNFAQGDVINTVITTSEGQTITLTLDTTLPKYYSREFTVRGTKGLAVQESNMILIEGVHNQHEFYEPHLTIEKFLNNAQEYNDYLPEEWKNITPEQKDLGHGGMDYIMFKAFFKAIISGSEMPIDVYDAATWMSITALSEVSIALGGQPQSVPDFTRGKWVTRPSKDVTVFPDN